MKHLKSLRLPAHLLSLLLVAASLQAATVTTKYVILFDVDNSTSTGCTYTVGTTSIPGIEHVLTTTVDRNGSSSTVTKVERQQCSGATLTIPAITVDSTGWPAVTTADGTVHVVTHMPNAPLGSPVPANMRLYIGVIEGAGSSFIETTPNGSPILYPTMGPRHRAVSPTGTPADALPELLDGTYAFFNGLPPMYLGTPVLSGTPTQSIGSVFGVSGPHDIYFLLNIGGNATGSIVANPDSYTLQQGHAMGAGAPGVLTNDVNTTGLPLLAQLLTATHLGTITLNADGSFHYANNGAPQTTDSFTYKATAGGQSSDPATVTFHILPDNPPSGVADAYSVAHGGTLNVPPPGVLTNDHDADGDAITAVINTPPSHASNFHLNSNGSFTYTHDGSNTLTDTFTYKATDGIVPSFAVTVTITIGPDAAPVAVADSYTVAEGGTLAVPAPGVYANDTDADTPMAAWTTHVVAAPTHAQSFTLNADGSFNYVHDGSETTADSFTYNVSDGILTSNTVTVSITVTTVNDAPVAVADAYSTLEDQTLTVPVGSGVLANDTDAEGNALTATVLVQPTKGTLTLNADGSFTYIPNPNANGSDSFQYTVTDNGTTNGNPDHKSATGTATITITPVNDVPTYTAGSGVSVPADHGPYSQPWATSISPGPADEAGQAVNFIVSNDNNGLFSVQPAISPAGVLTFTPAGNAVGSANVSVQLHDDGGTLNGGVDTSPVVTFSITITCPTISVGIPATNTGVAAAAFSQTFTESGAIGAATFTTSSTLPAGLSLSTAGVLSGTPTQTGSFPIVVLVTDSKGCTGTSATYTLTITCQTITVNDPATTTGVAAAAFSQTFTQSGAIGSVTFSTASALPTGLSLSTAGVLSGTPTQTGTFPIVVKVTDSNGCIGTGATYTLTITCQTINVTDPATNSGTANAAFSQTFTQSGSIGTATFTTSSTLPAGLTLSSGGVLSGTPLQTGSFPIVVTVTDSNGCTGTGATYTLTIGCQTIGVTNPATTTGTASAAFSQTFTAGNTIGSVTFTTASALPAGLTLSTGGVLSGTPTQTGSFPIVVTATDANGCSGSGATYTLVIGCQTITVTNPANSTGVVSAPFSEQFTQGSAIGTATFTTASSLPNGLSLSTSGLLSGTPLQSGSFPIVVTVTDSNGCTGTSATYTLVINCQIITVNNPSSNSDPAGTALVAANFTFTQSGAVGGATFTTASTLPTGVTLTTAGVLTGTPSQGGSFPIVVTVTDGNGCTGTNSSYTLTITCPVITVTNPATSTGTVNVAFSQTFTQAGAIGGATFTTASALPAGLSLSTGGVLSGTPTQSGSFPIVVTVTDGNGCTGTGSTYTLVIGCQVITVNAPATNTGTVNAAFSQQFTASNTIGTVTFTTSSPLPGGITLASDGTISGTPIQTGSFPIVVTATDANGCSGNSATYTLTIGCQVIGVTNPATTTGTASAVFSQTFTAGNTIGSVTFTTASALPTGLTLSTGGVLSGTPTQTGSFPIVVTATDANGCSGSGATYTLVIGCQTITVTNPANNVGTVSSLFSEQFTQSGAIGTATFSTASSLPTGLTLSSAGLLSGTPTQSGSFPIVVTVTDGNGCTGTSATYTLTINCQIITVNNPSSNSDAAGTALVAANFTFTQSGAVGGATFTTASTLPTGVTLTTAGVLTGTPSQGGSFPIVVTVTDGNGCTGTNPSYTLTITCPVITVTNPGVNSGTAGVAFGQTFTQSGGIGTITWSESGPLPSGITLNSSTGVLSGTTHQVGSFPITVTATDQNGCQGSGSTYTLTIGCQTVTVTNPATNTGTVDAAFTATFTVSGILDTVTWSETGSLPAGVTLNSATGVLSGTPTVSGSFPITVKATDTNGCFGTSSYTLTINCQTITVTNPATTTGVVDTPFSQTFTQSAAHGTATFTTASPLPAGLTLSTAGVLSGTPTVKGSFSIVVTVTDSNGCQGTSAPYPLVINCQTITVNNPATNTGTAGTPFSQTFTQSGAHATATFTTASTLPSGFSLSTAGVLSGTTTQHGSFPIVVTVTDANGCTGTGSTYTLNIGCNAILVTNPANTSGTVASAFSEQFTSSGTLISATYTTASTLPTGITLSSSGLLSGTPTQSGSFPIVVTVTDGNGCAGSGSTYTLTIACNVIGVTNAVNNSGTAGTLFSATFTQSGGNGTITWSETGALPAGITLGTSTGVLSGTTSVTGSFPITVTATDGNGCTGTGATYTLIINCQTVTVTNPGVTSVQAGTAFDQAFTATGILGTATWSETGALPSGITLNTSTGHLAGTSNAIGSYPITVKATDTNGCFGTSSYTLTVTCPTITVSRTGGGTTMSQGVYTTAGYSDSVTATGGSGTYTYAIHSGSLPTGLSLSSAGAISGTPTQTGTFTFTVRATDGSSSCTGDSATFTLKIGPKVTTETYAASGGTAGNTDSVGNTQAVAAGFSTPTTPYVSYTNGALLNDTSDAAMTVTTASVTNAAGTITFNTSGGWSYVPAAGFTGTASFNYNVTSNGVSTTSTINIVVSSKVWYVQNNAAGGGNGVSSTPFNTLAAASTASAAGDIIYVATGDGTTTGQTAGITLKANQQLIGNGVALVVNGNTLASAGTKPLITNTAATSDVVTLNDGNVVKGLTITGTAGARDGIAGSAHAGFTGDTLTIQNNVSAGLHLTSMTGTVTVTNSTITGNGTGVAVGSLAGSTVANDGGTAAITIDATNTIAANAGQHSITIQDRAAAAGAIAIGATITDNGTGIVVNNNGAGTINLTGTQTLGTTTNPAVSLTTNTGATINFSGTLGITTSTGIGFTASGGGTLNVTGTANITTGAAANGLSINAMTIGGSGVTFSNVTTTGATTAINLVSFVNAGAVTVNGGTITNGTTGVSLQGTNTSLTLAGVTITGPTTGITNTTNFGTLTIGSSVSLSAVTAINMTGGTISGTFSSVTSTGGTNGVSLTNIAGSWGTSAGALSGATGATFNVSGGSGTISWPATITQAGGANAVTIAASNSASITFSGNVNCNTSCTGVSIGGSSGSYTFSGGTNTFSGAGGIAIGAGGESGSVSFSAGTTITTAGTAFLVDGTTGNVTASITYSGTITKASTGVLISVNKLINPGTLTMTHAPAATGNLTQSGAGANAGISITNSTSTNITIANASVTVNNGAPAFTGSGNTGATINLQGIALTANGNKQGMLISGGGTINISDGAASSTINASGGSAKAIDGTTTSYTGTLNLNNATITDNSAGGVFLTSSTLGGNGSTITGSGPGLTLNTVALTNGAGMTSVTSTGGANGISLTSCTGGTYTVSGGALSGNSGATFLMSGGSASVTDNGTISQANGAAAVSVSGITGGTISLGGAITGSSNSTGVSVAGTGGTVSLTGGITLNGTADVFSASGVGLTINVTGTNTVGGTTAVTSGVAVTINNATIGASNVTFQKVSQNGGSTGIYLNNTGSTGTFTVTGTGSAGTGGTIQNTTGADAATNIPLASGNAGSGIFLYNVKTVSFSWMQLNGHANYAIYGNNISTSFTLDHSVISGSNGTNDSVDEGSIAFDDLHGSATISNSNISGGWEDNLRLRNTTGTLNRLTVSNTTFGNNSATFGNTAMNMAVTSGTPTMNVTVTGCTFTGSRSHFVQFLLNGTSASNSDFQFTGNTLTQAMTSISGAGGVFVSTATNATGNLTYNIQNNTIHSGAQTITGGDITVAHFGTGTFSGTIDSNIIGSSGVSNSGSAQGNGITVDHYGGGTDTVHVTSNTVRRYNGSGINIDVGDAEYGGQGTVNLTVTGNTVAEPEAANALHGMYLNWGLESTPVNDAMSICATIGGAGALKNTLTGSGVAANGGLDLYSHQRFHVTTRYPGYAGANNDNTAVGTFLSGQNTMSANFAVSNNVSAGGGGYVGGAPCP
ncbi:MAG TPA: putative Ig domain-containing protein [Thermoanaerobaculia bacterium]